MPKNVLIATATIQPQSGMPGVQRNDVASRMSDYCEALNFYLNLPDDILDAVVFLENSDADLTPLTNILKRRGARTKKDAVLLRASSDYPANKGKGYGEFRMIDRCLPQVFGMFPDDTRYWKVTGRLKVLNLTDMIQQAPQRYSVYCDLRDVPLIGHRLGGNQWMDLRVFSFTRLGYEKYFMGRYDMGFVLEHEFFFVLARALAINEDREIHPRFKTQPAIDGVSGYSGISYRSRNYILKEWLRRATRKALPVLWL